LPGSLRRGMLLTFKGEVASEDRIREYQAPKWGISDGPGETCVIDLSALAAPNLKTPRDRKTFLAHRLSVIRTRIEEHTPKFVVAYGATNKAQFEPLVGGPFDRDGRRQCGPDDRNADARAHCVRPCG
jgi:hypothetical protein